MLADNVLNLTNLPDHDDGEVEDVPRVPEVGIRMLNKAHGNYPHYTFTSKDDCEDYFNFFEELVGGICVTLEK